jgi:hypothetical protein
VLRRYGKSRRITARGRDIYAFTAPLVCEATARLLGGKFSSVGTQTPGMIFDVHEFLSALASDPLTFEITASLPLRAVGSKEADERELILTDRQQMS